MNELYPSQELDGHREDSLKVSTAYYIDNKDGTKCDMIDRGNK